MNTRAAPAATSTFTLARQAIELACQHRDAGIVPFGELLSDDFRALVLESLGQFGPDTDENQAARTAALNAYRTVALASVPMTADERIELEAGYNDEKWDY